MSFLAEESARLESVGSQWDAGARAMHASMPDQACTGAQGSCLAATDALYTPVVRCVVRLRWCEALHKPAYPKSTHDEVEGSGVFPSLACYFTFPL
jgi:hypothetical protein